MLIYEQISQQKGSWLFLRRLTTQVCKMSSVNPKVVMKMYGVASPNLQDAVYQSVTGDGMTGQKSEWPFNFQPSVET